MASDLLASRPCLSMRLVRPFVKLLRTYASYPKAELGLLEALDADARIPFEGMQQALQRAIEITGEADLGLKAARMFEVGELGALEYAVSSAATLQDAIDIQVRYMRLLNDAMLFRLDRDGELARVMLDSTVSLSPAAEAFELAAFHVATRLRRPLVLPGYEVCFRQPAPDDLREYTATFGDAALRFHAPFTGFVFQRSVLEQALPTHDPHLHDVLRKHADLMLASLPKVETWSGRVRAQLLEEMRGGDPSLQRIARALGVGQRELRAKLAPEGTDFAALREELRRELALRYAADTDLPAAEIAFLLGLPNARTLQIAFKRWTGLDVLAYRRAHGR